MMRKHFLLFLFLPLIFQLPAFGQKKILERLMTDEPDSSRSSSFLPIPAFGYAKETGWQFGLAGLYSFYTSKKDTLTRNSNITGLASLTTRSQYNFQIKGDAWSPGNRFHYLGEVRYRDFPFKFYGVGNNTAESAEDKVVQRAARLSGGVEKLIARHYYIGLKGQYEKYAFKEQGPAGIYAADPSISGKSGGDILLAGISQIFDSRNTNTYTTSGSYARLSYSYAPDIFRAEDFTGSFVEGDLRHFQSLSPRLVLAGNVYFQSLQGPRLPFYLLPQLGGDQFMRGYYLGRYRDQNLLSGQLEIRYHFIPRLGIAAFGGAGDVYKNGNLRFNTFKPTYGAGLRYFVDVVKGLSLRIDYGVGEKNPGEERQKSFYISFGEAF